MPRSWFGRSALLVAPDLLGKRLECRAADGVLTAGRIVETEAYTADDEASHTFRGRTARNATMFGPPGHLYVYLSYGIHRCANVVTGAIGEGEAVLLRAVVPIDGIEVMSARRGGRLAADIANGPGKLCAALGIELTDDGVDVTGGAAIRIVDDGTPPPTAPRVGPRVGITRAADLPRRFRLPE